MTRLHNAPPTDQHALSGISVLRLVSFDYLRLFAMALVTIQHGMSVFGYYGQTSWANISLGQCGVGIFCAISGYLAFVEDKKTTISAGRWLQKRLWQIYPAYWIVTVVAFMLAWVAKTKPIDSWLFLSQMLGTGYFTHGWELVNVVSWFISLILLCYSIAFFGKWSGASKLVLAVTIGIAATLLLTRGEISLSRHVLTFCIAGLLALMRPSLPVILAIIVALFGVASFQSSFFYAGFSISLLMLASRWQISETKYTRVASGYVYEYFLVHGIFLAAFARLVPNPQLLSGTLAIILAIAAAVALNSSVKHLVGLVRRCGTTKASSAR